MTAARDEGSAGVEAAVAVTSLLLVGFFIVGALRITGAGADVKAAARAAARAAASSYSSGDAAAADVVANVLSNRGVACERLSVQVGGDSTAGGVVVVDVTCEVSLADVVVAGFPGRRTVTGRGVELVDVLRGGQ